MLFSHASRLTATTCHCRLQPPFQRCGIWAQIPSFGSSPPRSAGAAAPNASLPPAGLNPLVQCESVHVHFDLVDSISVACRFLVPGQYVCVLMCVHMYLYIDMCLCVRCVQRVGQSINQLTYQLSNCVCACLFVRGASGQAQALCLAVDEAYVFQANAVLLLSMLFRQNYQEWEWLSSKVV